MIKADIILDTRSKSKKGYPVKIRVYCDITKSHKYITLKIYQDNSELILDSELRKRLSNLDDELKFCNDNFYKITDALDVIKNGIPISDIDLEIELLEKRLEILRKKKGLENGIGIIEFTKKLIEERKTLNTPYKSYITICSVVKTFLDKKDDIPINSITKEWLIDFDLFYKDKKHKDSTISTYIKVLKAIFKEAQSRESLNVKKTNPFIKLRSFKREKKEVELTIDDLIKIKNLNPNDILTRSPFGISGVKQIADLYLFQFAIGGHDLIDIANLKWKNIKDGRVIFKRFKNRFKKSEGEEVSNMLNDYCLEIIKKYGDKSSERIFTFLEDPVNNRERYDHNLASFNNYFYNSIKNAIGSSNNFRSKSTRYLFRTTAGNLLINDLIIMKIQGHTPQGITFGYQGAINHEVQDKEHQKILDLVFTKC